MKKADDKNAFLQETHSRAEHIADALGDIDVSLLAEAEDEHTDPVSAQKKTDKKRHAVRKKVLRAAAAAAAVLCVTFAAIKLVPEMTMRAYALETAEYPRMASYPTLGTSAVKGIFSGFNFNAARDEWNASRIAIAGEYDERISVSPELYAFTSRVLPSLLQTENGENAVCSPLNFFLASSMLAEITDGGSRAELLSLLGAKDITSLRTTASAAWRYSYFDDGVHTVIPASSIWLDKRLSPHEDVLKTLADTYYASSFSGKMGSAQFNKVLRSWLDDQTGGILSSRTKELGFTDDDRIAIASTLWFCCKWENEFNTSNTKSGIFHSPAGDITCSYLHKKRSARDYFWSEHFSAVCESFENSGSMWLILPDEGITPGELLADSALYSMLGNPYPGTWNESGEYVTEEGTPFGYKHLYVNLSLPKFDITGKTDLLEAFRTLGVTSVLSSETADFSPLSDLPDLFLSSAEHAARVTIDEKGCTAASYVLMKGSGASEPPDDEVDFILDRPFLFVIVGAENLPLYAGIVNQP